MRVMRPPASEIRSPATAIAVPDAVSVKEIFLAVTFPATVRGMPLINTKLPPVSAVSPRVAMLFEGRSRAALAPVTAARSVVAVSLPDG